LLGCPPFIDFSCFEIGVFLFKKNSRYLRNTPISQQLRSMNGGHPNNLKIVQIYVDCKSFSRFRNNLRPVYRFAEIVYQNRGYFPAVFFQIIMFSRSFFFLLPLHLPKSKGDLTCIFVRIRCSRLTENLFSGINVGLSLKAGSSQREGRQGHITEFSCAKKQLGVWCRCRQKKRR